MAGTFISTWMLSLLLLPFFMPSFVRCSPLNICCAEAGINMFFSNIKALENIVKECPGDCSLETNSNSINNSSTSEETCDFPVRFTEGVESLLRNPYFNADVRNRNVLQHLLERLKHAHNCSTLVEMYCSNRTKSDPIVSPIDLQSKLKTLMEKYKSKCFG